MAFSPHQGRRRIAQTFPLRSTHNPLARRGAARSAPLAVKPEPPAPAPGEGARANLFAPLFSRWKPQVRRPLSGAAPAGDGAAEAEPFLGVNPMLEEGAPALPHAAVPPPAEAFTAWWKPRAPPLVAAPPRVGDAGAAEEGRQGGAFVGMNPMHRGGASAGGAADTGAAPFASARAALGGAAGGGGLAFTENPLLAGGGKKSKREKEKRRSRSSGARKP